MIGLYFIGIYLTCIPIAFIITIYKTKNDNMVDYSDINFSRTYKVLGEEESCKGNYFYHLVIKSFLWLPFVIIYLFISCLGYCRKLNRYMINNVWDLKSYISNKTKEKKKVEVLKEVSSYRKLPNKTSVLIDNIVIR